MNQNFSHRHSRQAIILIPPEYKLTSKIKPTGAGVSINKWFESSMIICCRLSSVGRKCQRLLRECKEECVYVN